MKAPLLAFTLLFTFTACSGGGSTSSVTPPNRSAAGARGTSQDQLGSAIAKQYTLIDLGTGLPDSPGLAPSAINDSGVVVGTASGNLLGSLPSGSGNPQAFVFQAGSLRALPPLAPGQMTFADGINNDNQIVGGSGTQTSERATLWRRDGGITDLGPGLPGGQFAEATFISNKGEIVGITSGQQIGNVPTIFDGKGGATPACGSATVQGLPNAVNDAGTIVGENFLEQGGSAAFTCSPFTVIENPPNPTLRSFAKGINNRGQIVGRLALANGNFHPFLFQNGVTKDLGTLFPNNPKAVGAAFSINDAGLLVGFSAEGNAIPGPPILPPINPRAFVSANGGTLVDLNTLLAGSGGFTLVVSEAVNNAGQITGGAFREGVEHGFLLTPSSK
jgi:probable HAF family extracellular repeat protein